MLQLSEVSEGFRFVVLLLAIGLLVLEVFTIVYAIVMRHRDKRRGQIRERLRHEVTELLRQNRTDWGSWVQGLSSSEASHAPRVLKERLDAPETVDPGVIREGLRVLGVGDRAIDDLQNGDYVDKLDALTWLTVLRTPPSNRILRDHCMEDNVLRGAAARARATGVAPKTREEAVEILFDGTDQSLSALGMHTLYLIGLADPEYLYGELERRTRRLSDVQIGQVARVVGEVIRATDAGRTENLRWLVNFTGHGRPEVRRNAVIALTYVDDSDELIPAFLKRELLTDPDSRVRRAAIGLFKSERSEKSVNHIKRRLDHESNDRVRMEIVEALSDLGATEGVARSAETRHALEWVQWSPQIPEGVER